MPLERLVVHIEAQIVQVEHREHRRRPRIALDERMNLPQPCDKAAEMFELSLVELDAVDVRSLLVEQKCQRALDQRGIGVHHAVAVRHELALLQRFSLILAGSIRRRIEILEQRAMDHGEHIGYQRERARSQQLDDALAHEVGFALPRSLVAPIRLLSRVVGANHAARLVQPAHAAHVLSSEIAQIRRRLQPVDLLQAHRNAPIALAHSGVAKLGLRLVRKIFWTIGGQRSLLRNCSGRDHVRHCSALRGGHALPVVG